MEFSCGFFPFCDEELNILVLEFSSGIVEPIKELCYFAVGEENGADLHLCEERRNVIHAKKELIPRLLELANSVRLRLFFFSPLYLGKKPSLLCNCHVVGNNHKEKLLHDVSKCEELLHKRDVFRCLN